MLKLAKIYLWLLWLVPTLIFLGLPSSFSLIVFSIPLVVGAFNMKKIAEVLPFWAVIFFVILTSLSGFFGEVPLANILISYCLILQMPFGFAIVSNLDLNQYQSLMRHLNYLCFFQVCISLTQIFIWKRPGDSINGSMLGDPHGTNILLFLLLLTLLLNWELKKISKRNLALFLILCTGIGIKADAKIVLLTAVIFALLMSGTKIFAKKIDLSKKITALFLTIILLLVIMLSGIPQYARTHWISEINSAFSSKNLILKEVMSSRSSYGLENSILIGAGPTQTVSRSAIIAESTHSNSNSSSPLDVSRPKYYSKYIQTTGKFNVGPISSVAQPLSSTVGLIADYGIIGFLIFIFLYFFPILKRIKRYSVGRRTNLLLLCLFLFPLSYFNTFLEFPQAVFPFVIALHGMNFNKWRIKREKSLNDDV